MIHWCILWICCYILDIYTYACHTISWLSSIECCVLLVVNSEYDNHALLSRTCDSLQGHQQQHFVNNKYCADAHVRWEIQTWIWNSNVLRIGFFAKVFHLRGSGFWWILKLFFCMRWVYDWPAPHRRHFNQIRPVREFPASSDHFSTR